MANDVGNLTASLSFDTTSMNDGLDKAVKQIEKFTEKANYMMASMVVNLELAVQKLLKPMNDVTSSLDKTIDKLSKSITSNTRALNAQAQAVKRVSSGLKEQNEHAQRVELANIKLQQVNNRAMAAFHVADTHARETEENNITSLKINSLKLQQKIEENEKKWSEERLKFSAKLKDAEEKRIASLLALEQKLQATIKEGELKLKEQAEKNKLQLAKQSERTKITQDNNTTKYLAEELRLKTELQKLEATLQEVRLRNTEKLEEAERNRVAKSKQLELELAEQRKASEDALAIAITKAEAAKEVSRNNLAIAEKRTYEASELADKQHKQALELAQVQHNNKMAQIAAVEQVRRKREQEKKAEQDRIAAEKKAEQDRIAAEAEEKRLKKEEELRKRYSGLSGKYLKMLDFVTGEQVSKKRSEIREASRMMFSLTRTMSTSIPGIALPNFGVVSGIIRLLTTSTGALVALWGAVVAGIALAIVKVHSLANEVDKTTGYLKANTDGYYKFFENSIQVWTNGFGTMKDVLSKWLEVLGLVFALISRVVGTIVSTVKLILSPFKMLYDLIVKGAVAWKDFTNLFNNFTTGGAANNKSYNTLKEIKEQSEINKEIRKNRFEQKATVEQWLEIHRLVNKGETQLAKEYIDIFNERVRTLGNGYKEILKTIEESNKKIEEAQLTDFQKQKRNSEKLLEIQKQVQGKLNAFANQFASPLGLDASKLANFEQIAKIVQDLKSNEGRFQFKGIDDTYTANLITFFEELIKLKQEEIKLNEEVKMQEIEEEKRLAKIRKSYKEYDEERANSKLSEQEQLDKLVKKHQHLFDNWESMGMNKSEFLEQAFEYYKKEYALMDSIAKKEEEIRKSREEASTTHGENMRKMADELKTEEEIQKKQEERLKLIEDLFQVEKDSVKLLELEKEWYQIIEDLERKRVDAIKKEREEIARLCEELDNALVPFWKKAQKEADKYLILVEKGVRTVTDISRYLNDAVAQSLRTFGSSAESESEAFNKKIQQTQALIDAQAKLILQAKTDKERNDILEQVNKNQEKLNHLKEDFVNVLLGKETKEWQELRDKISEWNTSLIAANLTETKFVQNLEDEAHAILGLSRNYDNFINSLKNLDSLRKSNLYTKKQTNSWYEELIRNSGNPYDLNFSSNEGVRRMRNQQDGINPLSDSYQALENQLLEEERLYQEHLTKIERMTSISEEKKRKLREDAFRTNQERMSHYQIQETMLLVSSTRSTFEGLAEVFKTVKGEQNKTYKAMFLVSKAFAMSEAIINGILATQKALASYPPPTNFIMAGVTAAAAAVNTAQIAATMLTFEGGGFTPSGERKGGVDGRGGFPAILHPNEQVVDLVKSPEKGGYYSKLQQPQQQKPTINIHNYAKGVTVDAVPSMDGKTMDFIVSSVEQRLGSNLTKGTGALNNAITNTYSTRRVGRR